MEGEKDGEIFSVYHVWEVEQLKYGDWTEK